MAPCDWDHLRVSSSMDVICPGFTQIDRLGEGGFGVVYLAKRQSDDELCAVKVVKATVSLSDQQAFRHEVFALRQLSHPNVVRFIDVVHYQTNNCIVMEYCGGGDLRSLLNENIERGRTILEVQVISILVQLLLALHHCHHSYRGEWTLLHRDIKPENVLFATGGAVKLADFGLAKILDNGIQQAVSFVGTRGYLSPEVLGGEPYDSKADMFSLGCLLFELCTLRCPDLRHRGLKRATALLLPTRYSPELSEIIQTLLYIEPSKRPSTGDLLSRPIIARWLQTSWAVNSADDRETHQSGAKRQIIEQEEQLRVREEKLRARERIVEAEKAALNAQLRKSVQVIFDTLVHSILTEVSALLHRLAMRSSLSPPIERDGVRCTKSPSPQTGQRENGKKRG